MLGNKIESVHATSLGFLSELESVYFLMRNNIFKSCLEEKKILVLLQYLDIEFYQNLETFFDIEFQYNKDQLEISTKQISEIEKQQEVVILCNEYQQNMIMLLKNGHISEHISKNKSLGSKFADFCEIFFDMFKKYLKWAEEIKIKNDHFLQQAAKAEEAFDELRKEFEELEKEKEKLEEYKSQFFFPKKNAILLFFIPSSIKNFKLEFSGTNIFLFITFLIIILNLYKLGSGEALGAAYLPIVQEFVKGIKEWFKSKWC